MSFCKKTCNEKFGVYYPSARGRRPKAPYPPAAWCRRASSRAAAMTGPSAKIWRGLRGFHGLIICKPMESNDLE